MHRSICTAAAFALGIFSLVHADDDAKVDCRGVVKKLNATARTPVHSARS